jgi:hypothetical protein
MSEHVTGRLPYGPPAEAGYEFRPYVYRGTGRDSLTPGLPRGPRPGYRKPRPDLNGRCAECGYVLGGRNHKIVCGP